MEKSVGGDPYVANPRVSLKVAGYAPKMAYYDATHGDLKFAGNPMPLYAPVPALSVTPGTPYLRHGYGRRSGLL